MPEHSFPTWQKGMFALAVFYLFLHWLDTYQYSSLF